MEWAADLIDTIVHFFNFIVFYFNNFFEFFDDFIRNCMKSIAKLSFWLSYQAMLASSELVDEVVANLNISSQLNSAWSSIPVRERQMLAFFKIPEIINTIFSAVSSRFVMGFMPGSRI